MSTASELAGAAARAGGRVLREMSRRHGTVRTKSTSSDFVTEADVAAGEAVVRAILAGEPDARFVVEEPEVCENTGAPVGDLGDPRVWVVDPLDGTTSFRHDYPCYAVSVALLEGGQPVAGGIYNVPSDELFLAALGEGATHDGRPIAPSRSARIEDSLLVTGFPYDRGAILDRQLTAFGRIARDAHGVRRDGSAAIDLTHVAAGRADGFWEFGLQPWDMAAGVLIATEAGAIVTDVEGRPWSVETWHVVAANPTLHPVLLEAVGAV